MQLFNFEIIILVFFCFVKVIYDKVTGRSRGFGFVTMGSAQEAASAVDQLDGYVSAC